jgi:succinate-semialdehyde dehydrogenase/glutarate-semialdehyde dehydrogenase
MNTSIKKVDDNGKKESQPKKDVTICINPVTGEKLAEYRVNTIKELQEAVQKAKIAQPQWAAVPLKQRKKHMMKIRGYIMDHIDEISEIISKDNGKSRVDAMETEVVTSAMAVSFYCNKAAKFLKPRKLPMGNIATYSMGKRSRIIRSPFGIIGIISPWNYPFSIPFSEVIMALLAGNAVILKTASETQLVGNLLKKCIESAGLPENIFTYINIPGSIAGDAFLEAGIDKLFFTGSVAVGKYLMKKASETLTPLSLELGGNDPMIVCDNADLYRAAYGAIWAGMQNAGQSCGGVERIYVDKKVYNQFLILLKNAVESLRVGPDIDFNVDIGAMTTKRQMETVRMHIDDALQKGATIYAQSKFPTDSKEQFLPCVVLTDVNHEMLVMKDETFGPVVGVMPYNDIDEAIRLANDSYLGLTASVWSKSRTKAQQIGKNIKAGAITINDHLFSHGFAETPWGGFKQSGIGRTHGEIGFAEMTQPQVIVNDIMPFVRKQMFWHPHSKKIYEGLKGSAILLYGKNIFQRIKGCLLLMRTIPRMFRTDL